MASRVELVIEKDRITGLPAAVQAALSRLVAETAANVEGRAKENVPVQTGFLRNSITHEANGLTATVSVGADYGINVELGTVRQAAQPYLTPALEAERSDFRKGVADAIKEAAT